MRWSRVPGGSTGIKGKDGGTLPAGTSFTFTVADGDPLRLQELLAELDYLPLTFTPTGAAPAARNAATPQLGTFAWRWTTLPAELTSLWTQGEESVITKAAVMTFENQNGLIVDGLAGPSVWSTLLADVAAQKVDTAPYTYVLVSKVLPENLTLYNNGAPQYTNIPVNTGRARRRHDGRHLPGLRARHRVGHEGDQPRRQHLRRPRRAVGELLQRRRRAARLRARRSTAFHRATAASK